MPGERIWVGIDAGVDQVSLCATDERGEVLAEVTTAASAAAIADQLSSLDRGCSTIIGIEAGSVAIPLTRNLRAVGYDVRVLETRRVSRFLQMRQNKTDRNDARGIAEVTRLGEGIVSEVLVKSSECQRLRSELVLRMQLMRQRLAIESAIRAVLRLNGAKIARTYSGAHLERSVQSELVRLRAGGSDLTEVLTPALQIAVALRQTLEKGSRRLARTARSIDACRRLMTIPGVGVICALSFYTAIEDP
jgi:transposase